MTQILDIPIATGLDENSDARLRDALSVADDVVYKRRGGLTPRRGQERLTVSTTELWISNGKGDRALIPRGNQLAVVTDGVLQPMAFDVGPASDEIVLGSAGVLSAYAVERANISGSANLQRSMTFADGYGKRVYVWTESTVIYFVVVDKDTGAVLEPATYAPIPGAVFVAPYTTQQPKVVFAAGRFWVLFRDGTSNVSFFAVDDPGTLMTVSGDLASSTGFAALAHPAGRYFIVARQTSATNVQVTLVDGQNPTSGGAMGQASLTIASQTVTAIGLSCTTASRLWVAIGAGGTAPIASPVTVARLNATTPSSTSIALAPVVTWSDGVYTDPTVPHAVNIYACSIADRGVGVGAFLAFSPTGRKASDPMTFFRPSTMLYPIDDSGNLLPNFAGVGPSSVAFGGLLCSDVWIDPESSSGFCAVYQTVPSMASPNIGIVPALGCMHIVCFSRATTGVRTPSLSDQNLKPCQVHATFGVLVTPVGQSFVYDDITDSQVRHASCPSAVAVLQDRTVEFIGYALERADTSAHAYLARSKAIVARSHAQMGGRTFIAGGMPSLWDGRSVVEWGFVHGPRYFGSAVSNQANSIGAGTYSYAQTNEWVDANGGVMRGPVTDVLVAQPFTANQKIDLQSSDSQLSYKTDFYGGMGHYSSPSYKATFRTEANSTGPLYRLTPINVPESAWTRYGSANTVTTDAYPDTGGSTGPLAQNPTLYTSGGILEADPTPSCTMVTTWQQRFVIAGTDDDSVWFSTENEDGEVPYFSVGLRLAPFENGRVTGLAVLDEKLVLFKADGIYTLSGQLPNKQGFGSIPTPVQVSTDAGCVDPQSVVVFPQGVMFRSARGLYVLDRSLNVSFLGEPVAETIEASSRTSAPLLVTRQNHIRFDAQSANGANGPVVVFDYLRGVWTRFRYFFDEFTGLATVPLAQAVLPDNTTFWLDAPGDVYRERASSYDDDEDELLPVRVRSGWIKAAGPQGYFTAHRAGVLGKWGLPHTLTVNVYADYDETTVVATNTFEVQTNPPAGYQFVASVASARTLRMQAICIEVLVTPLAGFATTGPAAPCELSSFILEWDPIDNAPQRRIPAAQKR